MEKLLVVPGVFPCRQPWSLCRVRNTGDTVHDDRGLPGCQCAAHGLQYLPADYAQDADRVPSQHELVNL